jgi:hypothetical protein
MAASFSTKSHVANHIKITATELADVISETVYENSSTTPLQHSSGGSNFLKLPRELRDKIYSPALGSKALYFGYGEVIIAAALHHDVLNLRWEQQWYRFGLQAWMYSSKQIRMEALYVTSRTLTFTVIGPIEPYDFVIAPPGD